MLALSDGSTLLLIAFVLPLGLIFTALMVRMTNRHNLREERLKVLQKALEAPALDESTRRQVLEVLSLEERRAADFWGNLAVFFRCWVPRVSVAIGWILLVFCGGMWTVLRLTDNHRGDFSLVAFAMIGLVLVSLPMALREFDRRSTNQPA
ncbi:MAG: hypothetical protein IPK26_09975 [Planctomycetes bacterium]|nr:hypothetical protein [Planctomycetota bacterium]